MKMSFQLLIFEIFYKTGVVVRSQILLVIDSFQQVLKYLIKFMFLLQSIHLPEYKLIVRLYFQLGHFMRLAAGAALLVGMVPQVVHHALQIEQIVQTKMHRFVLYNGFHPIVKRIYSR